MKKIKYTAFAIVGALSVLWILAWTPIFKFMPLVIKQFMYAVGGVLTFALPIIIILIVASYYIKRKNNISQ